MKKITIPASPLLAVLKKVKEVISKHPTLDILSNVLVKVRRSDIQLIATDTIVTIVAEIEVTNDGDKGYNYLLPFDFFNNIVNNINGLDLTIELIEKKSDARAILSTLNDTFDINELGNADEFPKLPEFPAENSVGISGDFIDWLNASAETVAKDGLNLALQKIFVQVTNEGICIATTNAFVLMEKAFAAESAGVIDMLVSTKIAKALKGFKETSISWSETHIAFVSNGIKMIGTIQDEKYPNYKSVFPADETTKLKLLSTELTGVMEKVSLTKKPATLYFKREIGYIVVESVDTDYNRKVTVRIAADYSGPCEQIIINPEQLLLLLKQVDYISVNLHIQSASKPIVITAEADNTYRSLIMPLA